MFIFGCEELKPVLFKIKKTISKLFVIWTLLLLFILEGVFPEPAYAFLSSLDACAVKPECAEAIGLELSPAIVAPTAEAAGTTAISTTTATGATSAAVEAVAGTTVVGDMRLSGVAAFYFWNKAQNQQAQKKAAEGYCQAYPHDGVCAALHYQTGDAGNGDSDACKFHITRQFSYPFTINLIQAPDAQCGTTTVYAINGTPYSRGVYPTEVQQPLDWKDWPQQKRDAAVRLLTVLRTALNEVWQILQGKPVDAALIRRLIKDCEDVIPDSDDFGGLSDMEAQEAAIAICNTLEACLNPTPQQIIRVANCVTNTIDAFVPHGDKSFNVNESKVGLKKLEEAITNHPFAVREMAKQSEDLQRLKQADKLDRDFLEWLRLFSVLDVLDT